MNTKLTQVSLFALISAATVQGAVLLDDSFTYTNGNLVGQGSWAQTGSATNNPVQVVDGRAILGTGQDVYKALSSPQTVADAGKLFFAVDFSIQTASAAGDYFFHTTPVVGDSSVFVGRLAARSSGAGFQLGIAETSGTGSATVYGTDVLTFGTTYKAVVVWNSVTGATNDIFTVYVDPISGVEASNTVYATRTWGSATAEPATVAAINLRQGGGTSAPGVAVDRIVVATTFAEAAAIPEPSAFAALAGVVALGCVASRRRRSSRA